MGHESLWARMRPPLWARWALSLLIAAAAVVALIAFVHHHNDNGLAHISTAAEQRANREATVVVGQDQKPHSVRLPAGQSPSAALADAVRADMRRRIASGNVDGPLGKVGCVPSGHRGGAQAFTCRAVAAHVSYPFLAVATPHAGRAVYCKRDAPPTPSQNIPVSRRCRL